MWLTFALASPPKNEPNRRQRIFCMGALMVSHRMRRDRSLRTPAARRRGVIVVWTAVLMVVLMFMVAFSVDVGYMMLMRTDLQKSVDAAALAAAANMAEGDNVMRVEARKYAQANRAGGKEVTLEDEDIEYGTWDMQDRRFEPSNEPGNAVKVTAERKFNLFFAPAVGRRSGSAKASSATTRASAVAVVNPRDIVFVVDTSGSFNDDTEPGWATKNINDKFGPEGYPNVGNKLMQDLYDDFGFGTFPGEVEYIGAPMGVISDRYAYADLTSDVGPLTSAAVDPRYRIDPSDNEKTRKVKAYSWIIDNQIARMMPAAKPSPSSTAHYDYWEKYLDYILRPVKIAPPKPKKKKKKSGGSSGGSSGGGSKPKPPPSPKPPPIGHYLPDSPEAQIAALAHGGIFGRPRTSLGLQGQLALSPASAWQSLTLPQLIVGATKRGQPPKNRGWLPPQQDGDRIHKFNNPNKSTFPKAKNKDPQSLRNYIGYITYVQFMLDHGRDLQPAKGYYTPISVESPDCPYHMEDTAGGTFSFPPRTQPMHAARRSLIAAIQIVKERNSTIPDKNFRDWVSIVTYDRIKNGGPKIVQPLTGDYEEAMLACTKIQAVGDKGGSTATETGLATAKQHIAKKEDGGEGRRIANKVVVLLTDGVPNLYSSSDGEIEDFILEHSDHKHSDQFYANGAYWYDAALMQTLGMQLEDWEVYPVGVGLGTDYDFMDRMATLGGTANDSGQSPRGSGNPAEYEGVLTDIFRNIINNPRLRLVQ